MASARLFFSDDSPSPLGQLRAAGTIVGSSGVHGRRFAHYALVYLTGGAGRYDDELGTAFDVAPGDAFFVFPRVRHSYGPARGGSWDEFYVVFDGPAFGLLEDIGVLDRTSPTSLASPQHVIADLTSLAEAPRPSDPRGRAREVCDFLRILADMLVHGRELPAWLDKACAALAGDLDRPERLSDVAASVGMTYETFRKRFRHETGMSPRVYREQRRLGAARNLLRSTSLTQREIASALGFHDEFHFSKRFKQQAGVSPSVYRASDGLHTNS